jgi:hypothetical protein
MSFSSPHRQTRLSMFEYLAPGSKTTQPGTVEFPLYMINYRSDSSRFIIHTSGAKSQTRTMRALT